MTTDDNELASSRTKGLVPEVRSPVKKSEQSGSWQWRQREDRQEPEAKPTQPWGAPSEESPPPQSPEEWAKAQGWTPPPPTAAQMSYHPGAVSGDKGAKPPAGSGVIWSVICIGVIFAAVKFYPESESDKAARQQAEIAQVAKDANCRFDAKCWAEKHTLEINRGCKRAIEAHARYDFKWDDFGGLSNVLPSVVWKDEKAGHLTLRGQDLKFQNVFGTWEKIGYKCQFDTTTNSVINVNVGQIGG